MIRVQGPDGPVLVGRSTGGVLEVRAGTPLGRAFGLGWGHARDRIVQLSVLRIAGQGRAAELLQGTDSLVAQDRFIRRRGFARAARRQALTLTDRARSIGEGYASGVNAWLESKPRPIELTALQVRPEPWTVTDSLLVALLQSYLGLAQSQEVVERFIAHIGRSGNKESQEVVRALFAPHLDGWNPDILLDVELEPLELPFDPLCSSAFRSLLGSNAYALPPSWTRSGAAMVGGEPHLDTAALPPSFSEAVLIGPDTLQAGVTVPGVPGVLAGRWTSVGAAITYGFVDQIDLFVEEVREGTVRRGDEWVALERIEEQVARRGSHEVSGLVVWRSELGVLLGDPSGPETRRVLALKWALDGEGMEDAFSVPFALETAGTVDEARQILSEYPQSFQYALADTSGAIGLQQCGRAPRRAKGHSGLNPQPGWDRRRWWGEGAVPGTALLGRTEKETDEPIVTANETSNPPEGVRVVNLGLSTDRRDRMREVLTRDADASTVSTMHRDRRSNWARRALDVLRPLLPDNRQGRLLAQWDGTHDPDLEAPSLFARLEGAWLLAVYGDLFDVARTTCAMPTEAIPPGTLDEDLPIVWSEANSVTTNVPAFREALLNPEHAIFGARDWEALARKVAADSLAVGAKSWRRVNRVRRAWFLFAGSPLATAPVFSRSVSLPGAMDTPEQGRIHRIAGRVATVAPVWRMVADLSEDALHTALAGGPSDRLLGPLRTCDLPRFERYELKKLPLSRKP
ncbi:MAG: penicillin acylase family protein [Deltaproteobacteria bacterium]|nr:penicillin acylase family protein [Deltaproteobacteria bacterium]